MSSAPTPIRLLFVDDEPSIRFTLPAILEKHGFEVTAAETVADALREINAREFDVLISDLNIGEPGDGFTVVSAMRRTQPRCINFILTGYPAFESALQAIRSQVDDYLVKPANIAELVGRLHEKLSSPREVRPIAVRRMADRPMKPDAASIFFEELLLPKDGRALSGKAQREHATICGLFKSAPGQELRTAKETLWGAVSALTYYVDHVRPGSGADRLDSAWFGAGCVLKEKAWTKATAMLA